jgi:hypothetical protein
MRQAIATAVLLAGAVYIGAARPWVVLVPIVLRVAFDGWGFFRTTVWPLFTDD